MSKAGEPGAPTDEFTTAMQQLSAEAAKNLPPASELYINEIAPAQKSFSQFEARLESLEKLLGERLEKISTEISGQPAELTKHFTKIDEQLAAIRSNDSVNQQLFDSLHSELRKYRDNFLHESLQKPFIHDLVMLYDDLNGLTAQLRSAADEKGGKRGHIAQWRDNLENAVHSLLEILHRFEVREIEAKEFVDRSLHKVISFEPADFAEEDGRIVMRVKRGFLWRGKLVRPEEVIAKRFG
jgi:molecular chaperone GrpE (heat shock protein)